MAQTESNHSFFYFSFRFPFLLTLSLTCEDVLHSWLIFLIKAASVPEHQFPKDHLILSQSASLVTQYISDPAQLFGNVAISALTSLEVGIVLDLVLVD